MAIVFILNGRKLVKNIVWTINWVRFNSINVMEIITNFNAMEKISRMKSKVIFKRHIYHQHQTVQLDNQQQWIIKRKMNQVYVSQIAIAPTVKPFVSPNIRFVNVKMKNGSANCVPLVKSVKHRPRISFVDQQQQMQMHKRRLLLSLHSFSTNLFHCSSSFSSFSFRIERRIEEILWENFQNRIDSLRKLVKNKQEIRWILLFSFDFRCLIEFRYEEKTRLTRFDDENQEEKLVS